jgi:fatty acid desaturase
MQRWRRPLGTLLIWTPMLALGFRVFTGILLGSMGMDIHFNSKAVSYVAIAFTILILIAFVAVGFRLRRRPGG